MCSFNRLVTLYLIRFLLRINEFSAAFLEDAVAGYV